MQGFIVFLQRPIVTIYWKKDKAEMCLPGWNWPLTFYNDYKFYPTYILTDWLTELITYSVLSSVL